MAVLFEDRRDAGRRLAENLLSYRGHDAIVLGLPRGGVVVGYELALALGISLDVMVVRKIGLPGNPEYAIGAIAETGLVALNEPEIAALRISRDVLQVHIQAEQEEMLRRIETYRGGRDLPAVAGKEVIVVDDGIATGFTMMVALDAVRSRKPARLIMAVPVAPPESIARLSARVDQAVCLATPELFLAVGRFYVDFSPVSDEEVQRLLADARIRSAGVGEAGNGKRMGRS